MFVSWWFIFAYGNAYQSRALVDSPLHSFPFRTPSTQLLTAMESVAVCACPCNFTISGSCLTTVLQQSLYLASSAACSQNAD